MTEGMKDRPCKRCGAALIFATTGELKNGKLVWIPLDARKHPLYRVVENVLQDDESRTAVKVEEEIYVSHFATCPHANEFSKGKKR